jgi:hypothetical protein
VGEAIEAFVAEERIDLVVLGTRGLGGSIQASLLGAVGMGSVTDWCVRRLRCAVLVVKDEAEGEAGAGAGAGAEAEAEAAGEGGAGGL